MRKVTLALLAAASRSMVGSSLSSSIGVPGVNGDVSRETSTPASAAARDTASRTATAASSSTASSSGPGSIPSPPPADVSRETSTLWGLVGVSRKSTSPASVCRVTVDVFESPLESTSATADESTTGLCRWPGSVDGFATYPRLLGRDVHEFRSRFHGRRVVVGRREASERLRPWMLARALNVLLPRGPMHRRSWLVGRRGRSSSRAHASDLEPKRRGQVGSGVR